MLTINEVPAIEGTGLLRRHAPEPTWQDRSPFLGATALIPWLRYAHRDHRREAGVDTPRTWVVTGKGTRLVTTPEALGDTLREWSGETSARCRGVCAAVGDQLGALGYLGAFGLDLLVTPDAAMLTIEINPRFQTVVSLMQAQERAAAAAHPRHTCTRLTAAALHDQPTHHAGRPGPRAGRDRAYRTICPAMNHRPQR